VRSDRERDMAKANKQCKEGNVHLVKIPEECRAEIANIAKETLDEASEIFDFQKPVDLVIFSTSAQFVIPELGMAAYASREEFMICMFDFSRRDIEKIIEKEFKATLFHEFSHIVRADLFGNTMVDLFEDMVSEGIASYVEKKMGGKTPYTNPIADEMKYLQKAKRMMVKKDYTYEDHQEWFYGVGKLPRWIGYRLGYMLVEHYMKKHPKTSFAELVRLEAKAILQYEKDLTFLNSRSSGV